MTYKNKSKVNFNIIESTKSNNIDDIKRFINNALNKLIIKEFIKSIN